MKRILITGATGYLGTRLIKRLADTTCYGIVAVGNSIERLKAMSEEIEQTDKVILMTSQEMFEENLLNYNICGAVHLAFSRSIRPNAEIASSLDYSLAVFNKFVDSEIPNAVYVSSQSIYGNVEAFRTTETIPAPDSMYAMAKYAGEKLFESSYIGHENLQHTILRLDLVIQSQNLVKALCKNAINHGELNLKGGRQMFSYIDADDVTEAFLALFHTDVAWKSVYNVGPDRKRHSLIQVAEIVRKTIEDNENRKVKMTLLEDETAFWSGMDTSHFIKDTGWKPQYGLDEMIRRIYQEVKDNCRL